MYDSNLNVDWVKDMSYKLDSQVEFSSNEVIRVISHNLI